MTLYSIDTSALITLDRDYSYDVFPGLWDKYIVGLVGEGRFLASEEVKDELKAGDDDLFRWLINNCDQMFVPTDTRIMRRVGELGARFPNFVASEKPSKNHADPFVVGLALEAPSLFPKICSEGDVWVITYEQPTGNLGGPKIPDVCRACGMRHAKLIEIFRTEGWKIVA